MTVLSVGDAGDTIMAATGVEGSGASFHHPNVILMVIR